MNSDERLAAAEARIAGLERRLATLEATESIKRLMRAYGYYLDKRLNTEIVQLFTEDCSVEIGGRGVYRGREHALVLFRKVLGFNGGDGLEYGQLHNHLILQGLVTIDPGGVLAYGRWRALQQVGELGKHAHWGDGIYENTFALEDGVWRIKVLHYFTTFYSAYAEGWGVSAMPNSAPSAAYPPDAPQTADYKPYPEVFVPPFHYGNPGATRKGKP